MSELKTFDVAGACGDRLFHTNKHRPDGPTLIICSAHPAHEGEVVNEDSILATLSEEAGDTEIEDIPLEVAGSYEELAAKTLLRVLGRYSHSYCDFCWMNPNPKKPEAFKHI